MHLTLRLVSQEREIQVSEDLFFNPVFKVTFQCGCRASIRSFGAYVFWCEVLCMVAFAETTGRHSTNFWPRN